MIVVGGWSDALEYVDKVKMLWLICYQLLEWQMETNLVMNLNNHLY